MTAEQEFRRATRTPMKRRVANAGVPSARRWTRRGAGVLAAVTLAVLAAGCHSTSGAQAPTAGGAKGATCAAFDPLLDLSAAMRTTPSFGASSDLFYLVEADNRLGDLRTAAAELAKAASSPELRRLQDQLQRLATGSSARRDRIAGALAAAAKTEEAAERALDAAATCRQVDMRDAVADVPDKVRKAKQSTLASRACEPAMRLWSASRNVDLTSDISTAGVASHVTELALAGDRGAVRDRLAAALRDHAVALRALHAIASPTLDQQDADTRALVSLQSDVQRSLDDMNGACLAGVGESDRIVAGKPEPRRATVTVRPVWSGALATLPHDEEFGSGFVVRWRTEDGRVETRIVTNNHVMDGAFEAEIVPGDPALVPGGKSASDAAKLSARLIRASADDDIAILRLDAKPGEPFAQGLELRLTPAREQEAVVAAGFPGVGVRPSFQVSKGTVSNSRFGAEGPGASALDAYVQHTAPIDPGNSGGPLLDSDGHLLGMNTLKIVARENVGLAIPTWRVQRALARADEPVALDARHAMASCNAVVAALASAHPTGEAMSRFGLALYEWTEGRPRSTSEASYRAQVRGEPSNPVDSARLRAYGAVRALVEDEDGVRPFEACTVAAAKGQTVVGTFRTRTASHELTFQEEHGAMRAVAFR